MYAYYIIVRLKSNTRFSFTANEKRNYQMRIAIGVSRFWRICDILTFY